MYMDPIYKYCIDFLYDKSRSELSKIDTTIGWARFYILNALQYEDELIDDIVSGVKMLEGIRPSVYMAEIEESAGISEAKDEKKTK